MLSRLDPMSNPWPPDKMVGKLTDAQIASRSTWDSYGASAAVNNGTLHIIEQERTARSTRTSVNLTDPADGVYLGPPGPKPQPRKAGTP